MNKYSAGGIRFISLKKPRVQKPLINDIKTMVYSVDLNNPDIIKRMAQIKKQKRKKEKDEYKIIEGLFARKKEWLKEKSIVKIDVNRELCKLFLTVSFSPQISVRTQDVVKDILKVKNPVSFMAREKILFGQ